MHAAKRVLPRRRSTHPRCSNAASAARGTSPSGVLVLDLVYVLLIASTFALVGLIAKGVEKL